MHNRSRPVKPEYEAFAAALRTARESRGWSQEAVAAGINVSRASYGHWEQARALPDPDRVPALARALGLDAAALQREVVILRASDASRAVMQHDRELAAVASTGDLTDDERAMVVALRDLGDQMGDREWFPRALAPLLREWAFLASPIARYIYIPGAATKQPEAAPVRLARTIAHLQVIAALPPAARSSFVDALGPFVTAFGIAGAHQDPRIIERLPGGQKS